MKPVSKRCRACAYSGLSYFHHSNDYYTESGDGTACHGVVDIWATSGPASSFNTSFGRRDNQRNGTLEDYEEFKFLQAVQAVIAAHPSTGPPLFSEYDRTYPARAPALQLCAPIAAGHSSSVPIAAGHLGSPNHASAMPSIACHPRALVASLT